MEVSSNGGTPIAERFIVGNPSINDYKCTVLRFPHG